mmetsp:Transcript_114025/g.158073  ORF Transcript_114025/g.158073 Transcript_114025/m.158073 type:complete len:107 (+) Transcript_114025:1240-1560(+)
MVAQEVVKAITQKFMPVKQEFYFDVIELYSNKGEESTAADRYLSLRTCLGTETFDKLRKMKLFMIGAGAIGCELLKNYSMLGLGSKDDGKIILTDPDIIEVSNLNR